MLVWDDTATLVALLVAPMAAALVAATIGPRFPVFTSRLGSVAAGAGFLLAAALTAGAARGEEATAATGVFAVAADRLAVAALLLIFGVSTVAQEFAVRYLAGDPRAWWFTGGASLLTAASAVMVTATTLVGIAAGWTTAGIALCLLLGTYWHLPSARDGVRRAGLAFLIGDGALWVAVGLINVRTGTVDLADLPAARLEGALAPVVAVLIVVAALSRSAQLPFHRWLPATLAAPTPVSALLHAGVVNAGGILLIRLSPLPSPALAAGLLVVAGTTTMVYGAAVMLVKPDIKGALAYSTMAQMGFMILTCGLGLWAATVIHLVAHGFYKATLFLSSGSAIARHRRSTALPAAPQQTGGRRRFSLLTAAVLPLAALYAATELFPTWTHTHAAEQALLLFAWVTGAAATWGWLQRRPDIAGALTAGAVLLPAAVGYVALISAATTFLTPALPDTTAAPSAVWVTVIAAVLLLGALASLRWSPAAAALRRAVYTHALSAGTIHPTTAGALR
ncbi:NADH-quinone oxidoreductase subunit L [Mycolicibacterium vanbaalenii]|uniref:NADH-quinone oxidoreductase subunit L n=1 Tax=Mycolicibacterium vanbaalenii TaxID=110539 RepID=A0A5S9QZQ1_MYCVN|nr:proton-conducting transporter membrane subunit [Mycolicibacterium vanbaalenii]CAA0126012.1 NADH-quinone oxidoreductase subunit L [Mycolicibacterium vanbaalenii]